MMLELALAVPCKNRSSLFFSDLHQHPRVATPQEPAALLSRGNEREAEKDKQGEIESKKLHMSKPLFHRADRRG